MVDTRAFWKSNPDYAHGLLPAYLDEAGKRELVETSTAFEIVRVIAEPNAQFQGKPTPRWLLLIRSEIFEDSGSDMRTFSIGMNPQRQAFMEDMRDWLKNGGDPIAAKLGYFQPVTGNGFYTIDPPTVEPETA